jgi:hypothetical protein
MKQYTGRWENNGLTEHRKAEMADGFAAEFLDDNPNTDLFYILEGDVKFKVAGEEFTATHDCLVKIPGYAPRAFTARGRAVMFDLAGLTHWLDLLEDYTSIKTNDPARLNDKDAMAALNEKYNCQCCVGIKKYTSNSRMKAGVALTAGRSVFADHSLIFVTSPIPNHRIRVDALSRSSPKRGLSFLAERKLVGGRQLRPGVACFRMGRRHAPSDLYMTKRCF